MVNFYLSVGVVILGLFIFLGLAVFAAIGIYVYRDAKGRGMDAAMWTILAVLAPGFIGFIIYLVVRADKTAVRCPGCGRNVKPEYSVCPECGYSLKNQCPNCSMTLENDWKVCPNCAIPIGENIRLNAPVKQPGEKSLLPILILVVIIPLVLCIALTIGIICFGVSSSDGFMNGDLTVKAENVIGFDAVQWCSDCDSKGSGIYSVISVTENGENSVCTNILVYANNGKYDSYMNYTDGSLFTLPHANITMHYFSADATTLAYFEYVGKKEADVKFFDESEDEIFVDTIYVQNMALGYSIYDDVLLNVDVTLPDSFDERYSVGLCFYDADGFEDHSLVSLPCYEIESFCFYRGDIENCESFKVIIKDENDKIIAESDVYNIYDSDGEPYGYFQFHAGQYSGKTVITSDNITAACEPDTTF